MFSGIIRHTGQLSVIEHSSAAGAEGCHVRIVSGIFSESVRTGDSVAVNGVCLTVTVVSEGSASFFMSAETIRRSVFDFLLEDNFSSCEVHLEQGLRVGDRIDGHIVYGHVDTVCTLSEIEEQGNSWRMIFSVENCFAPYRATKGSVSLNGVSLTIGEFFIKESACFSVYVIPHTFNETLFSTYHKGSKLNLEVDPVARYVVHAVLNSEGHAARG